MRRNQLVEDFIEGETVCLGFFVGVVGDPNTIVTDSVDNRFHHDSMGRKRSEPNASAENLSEACAIGSLCDVCTAGR
jgi:hypothetical protein